MPRFFKFLLAASFVSSLLTGCGKAGAMGSVFAISEAGATSQARGRASTRLVLDRSVLEAKALAPVVAQGPKEFDNALAMNIPYEPVLAVRQQLQAAYPRSLFFFKGWMPEGEAHVTVITPIEFRDMQRGMKAGAAGFSMTQIGDVAKAEGIQHSDLKILGLGSGRAQLEGQEEEAFFIVVESKALIRLRRKIHERYVASGGNATAFEPEHFYPHITVGFTKRDRDLHEADGVIKDMSHSRDRRFELWLR